VTTTDRKVRLGLVMHMCHGARQGWQLSEPKLLLNLLQLGMILCQTLVNEDSCYSLLAMSHSTHNSPWP
jgi:hypothetical protein